MSDFRTRLIDEYDQLNHRLNTLTSFILTTKFDELPEIDRLDLKAQYHVMDEYRKILSRRVSRLCD